MAGSGIQEPNRPNKPVRKTAEAPRKPLQVMHISRKDEQESLIGKATEENSPSQIKSNRSQGSSSKENVSISARPNRSSSQQIERNLEIDDLAGISMADLLGPPDKSKNFGIYVNPSKSDEILFSDKDEVIVFSDN